MNEYGDAQLVQVENEQVVTDSRKVAETFGKDHNHVMRDIRDIIEKTGSPILDSENSATRFFYETTYENRGKQYPMYLMNRDGVSCLVMGFTGKKANDWKWQYINAFNQMEKIIRERQSQSWIESRSVGKLSRKAETDVLKQLVEYAKQQGSEHADMLYMTYSKLANKTAGVTDRETATTQQLMNLSFVENIILNMVQDGIQQELPYKEIYRNVKDRLSVVGRLAYLTA